MSSDAQSLRPTRQRLAVIEALAELEEFHSAQQIHARLKTNGESVGLATVYRTLQLLAEHGEVDVLRLEDAEALYRRCSGEHHHHLVCRECGTAVEISADAVEDWTAAIARTHGFTDVSHSIEVFGVCAGCSSADRPEA